MTINWNQIPLEMKEVVVSEMDVRTRVNLSMCSKSDNQLVRGTKHGKIKSIHFQGCMVVISFIPDCETNVERLVSVRASDACGYILYANQMPNSSTVPDWRQTIWNIMSLIGTKSTVDSLKLIPYIGFQEHFEWFRNNFDIQYKLVKIYITRNSSYDESIFDWPLNTKIQLDVCDNKIPSLESFHTYDKIQKLCFDVRSAECAHSMTDEILKKMRNAKDVKLNNSAVTINGFEWWLRNWLTRKDDNEQYRFGVRWHVGNPFSLENVTKTLSDVIGKTEKVYEKAIYFSFLFYLSWKIEIKKNGKVGGIIKLFEDGLYFESEKNHR